MGISLNIIVNKKPIQKYQEPETKNTYVEGRKGSEYIIRVKNNDNTKKKVVLSVDGLNILTGDKKWEKGYVLDPFSELDIPGWRINKNTVSKFIFSDIKGSYNTDSKENIGVIGCMVFEELKTNFSDWTYKPYIPYIEDYDWYPVKKRYYKPIHTWYGPNVFYSTCDNYQYNCTINPEFIQTSNATSTLKASSSASINSEPQLLNEVSTGWGKQKEFKTSTDYSIFNTVSSETILIYYDSIKGLEKRGIKVKQPKIEKPKAFPGYNDFGCKPPLKSNKTSR